MKLLVVGAGGFIAKNLIAALENMIWGNDKTCYLPEDTILYKYSRSMGEEKLQAFCRDCDFVFYLAGINRPEKTEEYMEGNALFLGRVLRELEHHKNICPVLYASSIQASLDNEYGKSKRAGEELLLEYGQRTGALVYVYRFANVFGKWCRPNYNSVVATFCHNIARGLPVRVDEAQKKLQLIYIDDVVKECISLLNQRDQESVKNPRYMDNVYQATLQEIVDLLYEFKNMRVNRQVPDMEEESFSQRLYSTYLTYLPADQLKYPAKMNQDERGSFTELFRTKDRGQFSVNIIKPGITKGDHWHHTKNEKFIVVSGKGFVRMRRIDSKEITCYHVSGEKIEVIDIPPGYTHNITNEGEQDLVTIMWANENFCPQKPDTYFLKVEE